MNATGIKSQLTNGLTKSQSKFIFKKMQNSITSPIIKDLVSQIIQSNGASPAFSHTDDPNLVVYRSADNENNQTTIVDVSWDFTDVDTANDKVTVTLPTGEFVRGNPYNATRGTYSTTGTAMGGLTDGNEYVIVDNGDGTASFYEILTDADFAVLASYEDGETIDPYQAYACDVKIDITSQGTGTHSFTTEPLLDLIDDLSGNAVDGNPINNNLNETFRLITDGNGNKYIEQEGSLGRSANNADRYGKLYTDTVASAVMESLLVGKRYLYAVIVQEFDFNQEFSIQRAFLEPADVNTGTGVFTANNHGFTTGNAVNYDALSTGGAFPTPTSAFAGTIYVRSVTASTFTLHPSETDANNNTNAYVYSDTGTGVFCVSDPTECQIEAMNRQMAFDVCVVGGNAHDFSPISDKRRHLVDTTSGTIWGNGSSGLLFGVFSQNSCGRNYGADGTAKIKVFVPSGSNLVRVDTGVSITTGEYWTNDFDSVSHSYLYDTQAEAAAGNSADRIKWDKAASNGEVMLSFADKALFRNFDDAFVTPADTPMIEKGTYGVFSLIIDFEDSGGKALYTAGLTTINDILDAAASSRSYASGLTNGGDVKFLQGNTNEPHVSGKNKIRAIVFGAMDTDPTSIVNQHRALAAATYPTALI